MTELRRVYNEDVEAVDLLIGSLAENPLPKGFGFSDTFFRIFLVMGRRRLEADRFFTDDYTPELYTQWSLDYITKHFFKTFLPDTIRHYSQFLKTLTIPLYHGSHKLENREEYPLASSIRSNFLGRLKNILVCKFNPT